MTKPKSMDMEIPVSLGRKEALKRLIDLAKESDEEVAHGLADDILLAYIGDAEISKAYEKIKKFYA